MVLQREILSFLSYIFVYAQKLADIHALKKTWPAQIVYAISVCHVIKTILNRDTKKLPKAVLPILAVITPAHNLILLLIHLILEKTIRDDLEPRAFMSTYYFFGWALFFQMGNSNGLASIDVGAAYVGISSFNPWIVGSLLAINTFSGPILWTIFAFATEKEMKFYSSFLFFRGLEITLYLVVVTHLRHHLFVWTVFSPKLLYLAMAVSVINILHTIFLLVNCAKE